MDDRCRNIFISHVNEDDATLQSLKELLRRTGYDIRDGSIDSSKPNNATDPDYIKNSILAPRIRWAGVMVVLISPLTHESHWVEWEIEYAQRLGKRIVGVWSQGATEADLPQGLDKYADAVVGWQAERVMAAVAETINNWYCPDGTERVPREIPRYTCP